MWCVFREGVHLYLYKSEGGASVYVWRETLGCTASAWRHATTTARRGRAVSRGEWPHPKSGRPLTTASSQRLCVEGLGLDRDRSPVVLYPRRIELIGASIVPLRKSASESAF